MELPVLCSCGQENMVDWEKLEGRPLSKLLIQYGYVCKACEQWKPCYTSSKLFDESLSRLKKMRPENPSFPYHLSRAMRRALEINRRGRNADGEIGL